MKGVREGSVLLHGSSPPLAASAFKVFLFEGGGPAERRKNAPSSVVMRLDRLLIMGTAWTLFACADPVYDDAIANLGGEQAGVEPGPLHRPGQPCVLCHSSRGGEQEFSLAGTVYVDRTTDTPIENVSVQVIDSQARKFVANTNCAGNFYITPAEFEPDFPIWLSMERGDVYRSMDTPVYREASCAGCHTSPMSLSSPGHVYLIDDPAVEPLLPPSSCR
jgi:hypothetical protein